MFDYGEVVDSLRFASKGHEFPLPELFEQNDG